MSKDLLDLSFLDGNGEADKNQNDILDLSFLGSSEQPENATTITQQVQEEDWGSVLTKTLDNIPERFRLGINSVIQDFQDRFGAVSNESRYVGAQMAETFRKNPDDVTLRKEIASYGVNPDDILTDSSTEQFQKAEYALREAVRSKNVEQSPEMQNLREEAGKLSEEIKANAPQTEMWSAKGIVSAILGSGIEMTPAVLATVATRSPVLGSSVMASHVYGQSLAEGQEMGLSREEARGRAAINTLAEFATERVPLGFLIERGSSVVKGMAKAGISEGIQESITETINIAYDAGIVGEEMTVGEALEKIAYSGIVGTGVGTVYSGITIPARKEAPPLPTESLDRQIAKTVSPEAATSEQDALDVVMQKNEHIKQDIEQPAPQINEIPDRLDEMRRRTTRYPGKVQGLSTYKQTLAEADVGLRALNEELAKTDSFFAELDAQQPPEPTPVERREALNEQLARERTVYGIGDVQERLAQPTAPTPEELIRTAAQQPPMEAPEVEDRELTVSERRNAMQQRLEQQRVTAGLGQVQQRLNRPAAPTPEQLIREAGKESGMTPGEISFLREQNQEWLSENRFSKVPKSLQNHEHGLKLKNRGYRKGIKAFKELSTKIVPAGKLDPTMDTISEAATKLGGVSREMAKADGFDTVSFKRNKLFPAKGGRSFDELAEVLNEQGYRNRLGDKLDANDVVDMIASEVNNQETHYSTQATDAVLSEDFAAVREWARELGGTEKLQNAIDKSLRGENLGEKQTQVIGEMLDTINAIRSDDVPAAVRNLAEKRERRRKSEVDDFNQLMSEVVDEPDFNFDQVSEAMAEIQDDAEIIDAAFMELAAQAGDIDADKAISIIDRAMSGEITEEQAAKELSEMVRGKPVQKEQVDGEIRGKPVQEEQAYGEIRATTEEQVNEEIRATTEQKVARAEATTPEDDQTNVEQKASRQKAQPETAIEEAPQAEPEVITDAEPAPAPKVQAEPAPKAEVTAEVEAEQKAPTATKEQQAIADKAIKAARTVFDGKYYSQSGLNEKSADIKPAMELLTAIPKNGITEEKAYAEYQKLFDDATAKELSQIVASAHRQGSISRDIDLAPANEQEAKARQELRVKRGETEAFDSVDKALKYQTDNGMAETHYIDEVSKGDVRLLPMPEKTPDSGYSITLFRDKKRGDIYMISGDLEALKPWVSQYFKGKGFKYQKAPMYAVKKFSGNEDMRGKPIIKTERDTGFPAFLQEAGIEVYPDDYTAVDKMLDAENKRKEQKADKQKGELEKAQDYKFTFGKHSGESLKEVMRLNPQYIKWVEENKGFKKTKPDLLEAIKILRGKQDVSNTVGDLEQDSIKPVDSVDQGIGESEARERAGRVSREVTADLEATRTKQQDTSGVPDDRALDVRAQESDELAKQDEKPSAEIGVTGSVDSRGSAEVSDGRVSPESDGVKAILEEAKQRNQSSRQAKQLEADKIAVVLNDAQNITDTLPLLSAEQITDVVKAESRLYGENEKGILFTNGTGTGKTYTGAGVVKRAIQQGKRSLVVTKKGIFGGWNGAAKDLNFDLYQIPNTTTGSGGASASIVSYQNFATNQELLSEHFDLVVYDESHALMANMQGDSTTASAAHFALTNKDGVSRGSTVLSKDFKKLNDEIKKRAVAKKITEQEASNLPRFKTQRNALLKRVKEIDAAAVKAEAKSPTKVIFLSASPFSGHKSVFYTDGYLFKTDDGYKDKGGYNSGNAEQQFLVNNFGYRMKYNKANTPGADVNIGLLERDWADQMFSSGAMVGRVLDLPHDYSREFVVVEKGVGKKVDELFEYVNYKDYPELNNLLVSWRKNGMDRQLAEALRVRGSLDRIQKHLDLGRKVVVFHQRMNIQIDDPLPTTSGDEKISVELAKLKSARPDLFNIGFSDLHAAPKTIVDEFGRDRVALFNGENTKDRNKELAEFNKDGGTKDIIVISKDAGKEGLSAHDVSGKNQRVLIITNTPQSPADAIQMEGRIYRFGLATNAVIEYSSVQTNFEQIAFRDTVSRRTATAENLAMGSQARMLRESFREGYMMPRLADPDVKQGVGGKDADRNTAMVTEFDRAKTYYWKRGKKTSKTKAQEGKDYFATPEPIGLSMVNMARILPGEKALEPSAGHGAISRWLPETSTNLMIEQSPELIGELSLVSEGDVRNMDFEDLNVVNKFDAIVMNPPFGKGGSDAIQHLDKAVKHLADGGRVVAIYPAGGMADRRFDKWYEEENSVYLTADIQLPSVTFKGAGTGVMTRLLVLDKDVKGGNVTQGVIQQDLSKITDANELFERIYNIESLPRPDVSISGEEVGLGTEELNGKFIAELNEFRSSGKARSLGKRELKKLAEKYFGEVENTRDYWEKTTYTFETRNERNKFFKAIIEETTPKNGKLAKLETKSSKGISTDVVKAEVDKFVKEYAGVAPVDIAIVSKQAYVPVDVEPGQKVKAVYNPSNVSLVMVAENFNSAEEVRQALRHELVVHYGLRALLGRERYNMHMDRLLRSKDKTLVTAMNKVRDEYRGFINVNSESGQRIIAEEALASLAEGDLQVGALRRFINAIINTMKKLRILPDTASYVDAIDLIRSNAQGLKERVISREQVQDFAAEDDSKDYDQNPYLASLYRETEIGNAPVSDEVKASIRKVHYTGDNRSFVERVKEFLKLDRTAIRQGLIDQFASIKAYEIGKYGELQSAEDSGYKLSALATDTNAINETVLKYGVPKYTNGNISMREGVKPLQKIIAQVTDLSPDLLPVWAHWLAAKRVKDQRLIEKGKENLFTQEMVDEIFEEVNRDPNVKAVFEQAQRDYAAFNKAVLDFSEDAGMLNKDQRAIWENDSYVPFYRITEEAKRSGAFAKKGIEGQSAGIKALKGGTDKLNIIESMVQNSMHLISASYKNLAMQKVVELTDGIGMSKVPMDWKPVSVNNAQMATALRNAGVDVDRLTAEEREQYSTLFSQYAPQGDDIVSVMVNGKREYYEVSDPLLLNSVTALGGENTSELVRLLGIPKRLLTNMVTSTPPFMVRNFIRDVVSNYVQADKATGTTTKQSVVDALTLKPFARSLSGMKASINHDADRWQIMAAGGMSGEYFGSNVEDVTKDIVETSKSGLLKSAKWLFHHYREVVRSSEEATRIAVYRQVKENGGTDLEAAYHAKNVINFSRHGQYKLIQFLISTVPFFNARVQGLDRLYSGAKVNPASFVIRGAILFAATAALMAMNDDREEYWALNEWDRDQNWHVWIGNTHIRIPKPFEVGALFATVPERAYEALTKDERVFWSRMGNMFLETFSMNPIPQAFSPIAEQISNKSFFMDRPIVSMSLENLQPEMQFTSRTSEVSKVLAKIMPDFMPDWARSPVRIEHLISAYFGTVGGYALMAGDTVAKTMTDSPVQPAKRVTDYPLIKDFIREGEHSNKYVGRFYEMTNEAAKVNRSIKDLIQQDRLQEAREMKEEHGSILKIRRNLNRVKGRFTDINAQIKRVYLNKSMTAEQKRIKIDELTKRKNMLAQQISEKYWKLF